MQRSTLPAAVSPPASSMQSATQRPPRLSSHIVGQMPIRYMIGPQFSSRLTLHKSQATGQRRPYKSQLEDWLVLYDALSIASSPYSARASGAEAE